MADTAVLLEKIARYKDYLESETDEVLKEKYKGMVEKFEKQLAEVEQKVEKEEEKLEKKEEKAMDEVSEKLKKYTEMMNDSDDEDVKAMYKKKIEKLKSQIGEVKEQIKEEKKELQEKKDELKEAVKEVKEAEKSVRKVAIKKVQKTEKDRKEITKAKKERRRRLTSILTDLNRLVEETPSLRAKYEGEGVDLKRDAGRGSKPFGWRFKGKNNFKKPRPDQHGQPNVYYEGRANRADVKRKGNIKLEEGGVIRNVYDSGFWMQRETDYRVYGQPNPEIFGYFDNMYDFQKWVQSTFITEGIEFDTEFSSMSMKGDKEDLDRLLNEMIQEAIQRKPGADEDNFDEGFPDVPRPRFKKGGMMAQGGRIKVGTFDEAQLKNREDKKAVEKAMKDTGMKYVDTKMVKKGGKMFLEVYLIPDDEYQKSSKFAEGGEIKVGDKVRYKGAEYIATVVEVFNEQPLPYATIRWDDDYSNEKEESAYLTDLEKAHIMSKRPERYGFFKKGGEMDDQEERNFELLQKIKREKKEQFGYKPYGKTKGRYTVLYMADGEMQKEIRQSKEEAVDTAKRYSKIEDYSDVKVTDESGKEVKYAEGGETKPRKAKWQWKPEAIEKRLIPFWKSAAKKTQSKYYRRKYPNLVEKI